MSPKEAIALFDGRGDVVARLTAPASGLFLERVYYQGDPRDTPVRPAIHVPRAG
jgi:hypothetical protein